MRPLSHSLGVGLAAAFCLFAGGCATKLTAHEAYGVWQGTENPGAKRVQITFVAPDKVELEYPDNKDVKPASAVWRIVDGRLIVTGKSANLDLGLSTDTVNDESKLKLASNDGKFQVWKL